MLLSIYFIVFLEPSILSAQDAESQQAEQAELTQEELNQALFTVVTNDLVDEVRSLIGQGAEVNGVDEYGRTPLHIAAAAGQLDIVKLLITHRARLDIKDNAGHTPLHYAAGAASMGEAFPSSMTDIIRILLDNGANINARDSVGLTPLCYAADRRSKYMVQLLIDNGADIDAVDNRGQILYYRIQGIISQIKTFTSFDSDAERRINEYQEIAQLLKRSEYYVATNGNDNNPGTIDRPFNSLIAAIDIAEPGDTILIRGGTYVCLRTIHIDKSGLPGKPISIRAYPGEVPVFDCSMVHTPYYPYAFGFLIEGAYWHIKGIVITDITRALHLESEESHHNVLEQIVAHKGRISMTSGAGYNLVINCDAYQNFEFPRNGGNTDGFNVGGFGIINVLIGDRSWNNSDDGYDFYGSDNSVRVESCYAWNNGINIWNHPFFAGDGNGFKLGKRQGKHILIN